MTNWIDVTVKVDSDRVGEFYGLVGRFTAGLDLPQEPAAQETLPWDPDIDLDLAKQLLDKLSGPARKLFEILGSSAGLRYDGVTLAANCGIDNGKYGIAGTLAWPGRYCKAAHRQLPIGWDDDPETGGYYMTTEMAHLFAAARSATS